MLMKLTENSHKAVKKPNPIPNSRPFKPGQSGNPGGRPKDRMRSALRNLITDDDITSIMMMAITDAQSADPDVRAKARTWLVEQTDGKLIEQRESGSPGDFAALEDLTDDDVRKVLKIADSERRAS